jgi:MYXO-CTERM domain-containing protein
VDFCGYHNTTMYGDYPVPYGVLMDMTPASACSAGCGPSKNYVDNATSVHSHELVEAVTDTDVGLDNLGWYDNGTSAMMQGEAADLCNEMDVAIPFAGAPSGTYTVQTIWSNYNNGCIAVAPYCNGTEKPPSCTPCTSSTQCSGATPDCETNSASAEFGQCVQCLSTTECGKLTCNTTSDICVCAGNSDCSDPTPICGASSTCVACMSDADCKGNPAGSACASGSCVPCTKNSDCTTPPDTACNTLTNECYAPPDAGADAEAPMADAGHADASTGSKDSGSPDANPTGGSGSSGGGCSAAPATTGENGGEVLLALGLAGVFARRRRRSGRLY